MANKAQAFTDFIDEFMYDVALNPETNITKEQEIEGGDITR